MIGNAINGREGIRTVVPGGLVIWAVLVGTVTISTPVTAQVPATTAGTGAVDLLDGQTVLATVDGTSVLAEDVRNLYLQFNIAPEARAEVYNDIVGILVNNQLLLQYLDRIDVRVGDQEIDTRIEQLREQLKANNTDLATEMSNSNTSEQELRQELRNQARIQTFLEARTTDQELADYVDRNRDIFDNNQVRARHILIKLESDSNDEQKADMQKRLAYLKTLIEKGDISFEEAANKYSQDDGNIQTQNGGDLGTFPIRGRYIEEFSEIAFGLESGQISDPVETPFGLHLIKVEERIAGQPRPFEEIKPLARQLLAEEIMEQVVEEQRGRAQIDIKPYPENLLPPPPPSTDDEPAPAPPSGN